MRLNRVCLRAAGFRNDQGVGSLLAGPVGCDLDAPLSPSTGLPLPDGLGMMHKHVVEAPQFWATVGEHVTAKVLPTLLRKQRAREPVIAYLRDLEALARRVCDSREVIQIIASGRHVLGDYEEVYPTDGPFSRT
jgi:hypothetical protein